MEERITIIFNEEKIKEKYNKKAIKHCIEECNKSKPCGNIGVNDNIECLKNKWDINREDREQGFDSDCAIHCCQGDLCLEIFKDEECVNIKRG